jgi:hypothetical protein
MKRFLDVQKVSPLINAAAGKNKLILRLAENIS